MNEQDKKFHAGLLSLLKAGSFTITGKEVPAFHAILKWTEDLPGRCAEPAPASQETPPAEVEPVKEKKKKNESV